MRAALHDLADPKIAAHSARFFRSGKGEYGEGDCCLGIRDPSVEEAFLIEHYRKMPRTMLWYAIEKFPETRRRAYLDGTI
jgi:hypothetical protein